MEVNSKIKKAFCPPNVVKGNPCVAYVQQVVLPWFGKFEVLRKDEHGGNRFAALFASFLARYNKRLKSA